MPFEKLKRTRITAVSMRNKSRLFKQMRGAKSRDICLRWQICHVPFSESNCQRQLFWNSQWNFVHNVLSNRILRFYNTVVAIYLQNSCTEWPNETHWRGGSSVKRNEKEIIFVNISNIVRYWLKIKQKWERRANKKVAIKICVSQNKTK